MNLRARLLRSAETLGELETVRHERFEDGVKLATCGHRTASAYLLGYVAEMTLKCAFFRLWGYADTEPIGVQNLRTADVLSRGFGVDKPPESFHSPIYWAQAVDGLRNEFGRPLDLYTSRELNARAECVWSCWVVSMRYRLNRLTEGEFRRLYEATEWIRTQYDRLWR